MQANLDKVKGSLLGGAIGDSFGAPVEFSKLADIKKEYGTNGITFANFKGQPRITDKSVLASDVSEENFKLHKNQYLGKSKKGMGDEMVIKVTVSPEDKKITDVEVVKQSETDAVGGKILGRLANEVVLKNNPDIDAVSGATTTVNAFKDAVTDALNQIK